MSICIYMYICFLCVYLRLFIILKDMNVIKAIVIKYIFLIVFILLNNKDAHFFKYYNNFLDLGFIYILQDTKYKMLQIKSFIFLQK